MSRWDRRGCGLRGIIWYLGHSARTFRELKSDLKGESAKVLSARLKKLAADGVLERTVKPTSPPTVEYSLTVLGGELKPAIEAIRGGRPSAERAAEGA